MVIKFALLIAAPLLAFGLDDITHVLGYYPLVVGLWAGLIAVAGRNSLKQADERRKRDADAQDRLLEGKRREIEALEERRAREVDGIVRNSDRRIAILNGVLRTLRHLIAQSMEHADAQDRWIAVLETRCGDEFVRTQRPHIPPAIAAIDLASIFDESAVEETHV